jgi:hypothetical protein
MQGAATAFEPPGLQCQPLSRGVAMKHLQTRVTGTLPLGLSGLDRHARTQVKNAFPDADVPPAPPSDGWRTTPSTSGFSLARPGPSHHQAFTMKAIRTLAALTLAAFASACASPGATDAASAPTMSPDLSHGGAPISMTAMEPRMKAMKDMHQKMMAARSPAERQALMADHMKAMQEGMAMMKETHGGMQGMGGMDHRKGMSVGMAQRHRMMTDHMAMMQMMMDMMMQRMPASPADQ